MKRLGIAAAALAMAILLETAICFAGTLEIEGSYPKDGGTGLSPVNCAVKVFFNQDVYDAANLEANSECFILTGTDGKREEIRVLKDEKNRNMVLVVLNNDLEQDTEYRLTVLGDFVASSGDLLENDTTITFRTRNQGSDNTTTMIMMVVMFVGVIFFSTKMMKKQNQKDGDEKDAKVNPYKVSKETGKSVEEIVAKTDKQKRKKADEEARRKARLSDDEVVEETLEINYNKRVRGPRPISAAGSAYLSGKKAKARAEEAKRAAARAAGTTNPKKKSGKQKNRKK